MALNLNKALSFALLAALSLTSCATFDDLEKKRNEDINKLAAATSGRPVADSTSERAAAELRLLDSLQHRYPGRTTRTVITKVEKVVIPGKTLYAEVAPRVDTAKNRSEADSLLARLVTLSDKYKKDLEIQTEVARVKAGLLRSLNRRGILPDTTVFFPNAPGYWLRVARLASGRYSWTLNTPEQSKEVATQSNVTTHTPPVYIRSNFWDFWQFWAAFGTALVSLLAVGWLLRLLTTARS